jgi:hypothetical protein
MRSSLPRRIDSRERARDQVDRPAESGRRSYQNLTATGVQGALYRAAGVCRCKETANFRVGCLWAS